MKKIKLKLNINSKDIIKETPEDRKERLKYSSCLHTRIIENKKKISRSKQKEIDRNLLED